MERKPLSRLEVTVMEKTEEALNKQSYDTGLSIGEVIDRITLDFKIEDPETAANVLCEQFLLMVSLQNGAQTWETAKHVAANMMTAFILSGYDEKTLFNEISACIRDKLDAMQKYRQGL